MHDFALFLGKFLAQGTSIASVAPSSRWLSRTTVRNVDWASSRAVLELGAGTGPITQEIARNASPDCRVVVIERDPDFAGLLRDRFENRPNFAIVEGDACDLAPILATQGIQIVDHIISGLPVPSFRKAHQQALFQAVGQVLRPDGMYHQITEFPWVYWPLYRQYFHDVTFAFEPRNLPPAGAYFCRGPKL